MIITCSND